MTMELKSIEFRQAIDLRNSRNGVMSARSDNYVKMLDLESLYFISSENGLLLSRFVRSRRPMEIHFFRHILLSRQQCQIE